MKVINKRLIVSDFDGTLVNSKNQIPENVRVAVNEYVAAGGIFAVCTGRMLCSILPRVREFGLSGLVIAYQGSVIAEIESGKILKKNYVPASKVAAVCRYTEEMGYACNAYSDDILYTSIPKGDKLLALYEEITGVKAKKVNVPMSQYITDNGLDCHKLTFLVMPDKLEHLYMLLKDKFGDTLDVTCSSQILVEVSPKEDNKGTALRFLVEHFGIDKSSTVAIGDNLNDLSMIEEAEIGVAVGNAVDELKKHADYISASNDDGAVAEIIYKFGFR